MAWAEQDSNNKHGWLVSYADLMTVLVIAMMGIIATLTATSATEHTTAPSAQEAKAPTLKLPSDTLFDLGSAELKMGPGTEVLDRLALKVKNEGIYLRVEGHTDNQPLRNNAFFKNNWELSAARAISVVQYLELAGVPSSHIVATGYADTRPVGPNSTSAGRAANRRVAITLSETAF